MVEKLRSDENDWVEAMKDLADAAKRAHLTGAKLGHAVDTETKVRLGALNRKTKKKGTRS